MVTGGTQLRVLVWDAGGDAGHVLRCEELGVVSEHWRPPVLCHDRSLGFIDQQLQQKKGASPDARGCAAVGPALHGWHMGVGRWHWHVLLSGFRSAYLWLQVWPSKYLQVSWDSLDAHGRARLQRIFDVPLESPRLASVVGGEFVGLLPSQRLCLLGHSGSQEGPPATRLQDHPLSTTQDRGLTWFGWSLRPLRRELKGESSVHSERWI
mmetsp:Transcript_31516/g.67904  ORF Transcript_31516/g.67904 Transcript_31516/m.67904 type:complete len:209 (+) Transcript_31516:308-934(+)